ncbi:RNA 2',3'-cyclic phosphodiesterase [Ramlibacter sp.]|uniref:RNA 2',3'-cyclic phosphodiesterase n=1 Tax=Ramlibacter sp. TaxID=1917967 RepID=UPI002609B837|nr:RNA 2',3'-cyclic phosphodiesterase [Ramlibacter sp.]MDB5956209.1 2-5 ligase [Ramlibacter sp.]
MDPHGPTLRLFLGLWPSDEMRATLRAQSDAWNWPASARRTRPEGLHITLHFLGEVAATQLPLLQQNLDVRWEGCELLLDQPQVWPGGIAVLEASQVPQSLLALHASLGERLVATGLAIETRRYRPHVTFARKATGARPPADAAPVRWHTGSGYVLVQSLAGGRGYTPLQCLG